MIEALEDEKLDVSDFGQRLFDALVWLGRRKERAELSKAEEE